MSRICFESPPTCSERNRENCITIYMAIVCPHSLLGRPICLRKGRQGTFFDEKRFVRKASCSISNTCHNNRVFKDLIPDPERFVRAHSHFRFLLKQLGPGVCWQLVQQSFTWILHMEPLLFFLSADAHKLRIVARLFFWSKPGYKDFCANVVNFYFIFWQQTLTRLTQSVSKSPSPYTVTKLS